MLVEILFRKPVNSNIFTELQNPFFPLLHPWAEDKALYVLRAAMLVPVGALLWRYAKHPLAWSGEFSPWRSRWRSCR